MIDQIVSTANSFTKKIKIKKPKKDKRLRIVVCGSVAWKNKRTIVKVLKSLNPSRIEFVVTGTGKGAELFTVSVCKELGIPLYQAHPWTWMAGSSYLRCGKVMSIFKPNLVISFDDGAIENPTVKSFERFAGRNDIELSRVKK